MLLSLINCAGLLQRDTASLYASSGGLNMGQTIRLHLTTQIAQGSRDDFMVLHKVNKVTTSAQ